MRIALGGGPGPLKLGTALHVNRVRQPHSAVILLTQCSAARTGALNVWQASWAIQAAQLFCFLYKVFKTVPMVGHPTSTCHRVHPSRKEVVLVY